MQQTDPNYLSTEQQQQPVGYTPTSDERTMAILSHILTLVAPILAPLIIYLIKKDESKYVAEHAKESLNFQISMFICFMISFVLMFVLIGFVLMAGLGIFCFVVVIIATIRASDNKLYRYPLNFRFIK